MELNLTLHQAKEGYDYLSVPAEVISLLLNNDTEIRSRVSDDLQTVYLAPDDQEKLLDKLSRHNIQYSITIEKNISNEAILNLSPPVWL